ncbi:unknown [Akkermansia sp. CAG:344]|nr:unknown [Akkermansia sp. CAG:344]
MRSHGKRNIDATIGVDGAVRSQTTLQHHITHSIYLRDGGKGLLCGCGSIVRQFQSIFRILPCGIGISSGSFGFLSCGLRTFCSIRGRVNDFNFSVCGVGDYDFNVAYRYHVFISWWRDTGGGLDFSHNQGPFCAVWRSHEQIIGMSPSF